MAVLDTLTVLIEADATGIESVLKKTLNTVTTTVNDMNKQEVGWTGILTRTITPAIISGVASMFAMALANSMSFQESMADTGNKVGMTAKQMNESLAPAMKNISATTGVTDLNNLGNAYSSMFNLFNRDAKTTENVTMMLAKLEATNHGTAESLSNSLLPVLQAWGATTKDSAGKVIDSFLNASTQSGISIQDLASHFTTFQGKLINSGADIKNINDLVITFGVNAGKLGINTATSGFSLMSTALTGVNPGLNAAVGSAAELKKHLSGNTIEQALEKVFKKASDMSPLLQAAFGLDVEAVGKYKKAVEEAPDISKQVEAAKNLQTTTNDLFDKDTTAILNLRKAWAKLQIDSVELGSLFIPVVTSWTKSLDGFISDQSKFWKDTIDGYNILGEDIKKSGFMGAMKDIKDSLPGVQQTIGNFMVNQIDRLPGMNTRDLVAGPNGGTLNDLLRGSGADFSGEQITSIDNSAKGGNVMESLISALKTGGKGDDYSRTLSTMNINLPQTADGWSPKDLADALYRKFQGSPS